MLPAATTLRSVTLRAVTVRGGSNNVFIGYQAGYNEGNSNKLYISNSSTATPLIYGDFSTKQLGLSTNTLTGALNFPAGTTAAGGIYFGTDTNLYRSAANTLSTDGVLTAKGGMAVGTYAGVNAAPSNGLIVSGNVGIGTTTPAAPLDVRSATTETGSVGVNGARFSLSATPASTTSAYYNATLSTLTLMPPAGVTINSPDQNHSAFNGTVSFNGLGTVADVASLQAASIFYNSGTVSNYSGLRVHGPMQGGSATVNNAYGLYISTMKINGLVANGWGIYQNGPADINVFKGNIGVGLTSGINSRLTFATDTTAAGGILFGADTNLYRSAANTLNTDSIFSTKGGLMIGNGGSKISRFLSATASWDPSSIPTGSGTTTTLTVTGAALGDTVNVGFNQPVPGLVTLSGAVTSSDTVTVTLLNMSGAPVDLASGTLRADVWQH